ncbi:dihydroorotase [Halieaceae bacterium IMCC8485]|uniref:Dihydroorotase n=1 Tax=Candidatus Seongchinamella marina TaxID=2518990 RepID=A0ABT3SXP8_9GAMM|nr:dihydroorotase [Candidatus Seongchinamella marina]MCX2974769.1 dihydroorotase [Candidatus Seongchinamella marina]
MNELTITRPDDWHVHLRDGAALEQTCADMARYFGRVIVMPNLTPPATSVAQALTYRDRITAAMSNAPRQFEPLMVLYLTDQTDAAEINLAAASDFVHGVKLYPAGATTNSDAGVAELDGLFPVLAAMEEADLPLLVHGEVTDHHIDIFDREKVFIDRHLEPIAKRFPGLRIVFEHITTRDAVQFVREAGNNVAATITAHHLMFNRNDMLVGGIRPHYYCLPILKRNVHQNELMEAASSGNTKFFLGTDSAPHTRQSKESGCGCAGVYTAHAAIEFYAEVFDQLGALDKLEGFASHFGADFYRLPRNSDTVTLRKEEWQVPAQLPLGKDTLTPLAAGETIAWKVI